MKNYFFLAKITLQTLLTKCVIKNNKTTFLSLVYCTFIILINGDPVEFNKLQFIRKSDMVILCYACSEFTYFNLIFFLYKYEAQLYNRFYFSMLILRRFCSSSVFFALFTGAWVFFSYCSLTCIRYKNL